MQLWLGDGTFTRAKRLARNCLLPASNFSKHVAMAKTCIFSFADRTDEGLVVDEKLLT